MKAAQHDSTHSGAELRTLPHGWVEAHVSDLVASIDAGVSVNGEDRLKLPGEGAVLKVSAVSYGVFDPARHKVVLPDELGRARESPQAGCVIMSRSNTPGLVAASAYVDQDHPELFLSDKLWQLKPRRDRDVSMRWLSFLLASPHIRYRLSLLATGTSSSMKNISQDDLLTLRVEVPPFAEQEAIAQTLRTWARAIDLTERLIAAKHQRRKWLIQQLLTGKRRLPGFSDRWPATRLADVAQESTERNRGRRDQSAVRAVNKVLGMVPMRDRIIADDVARYKVVRRNWFAYNPMRINIGSICMWEGNNEVLVSPDYVVFRSRGDRLDPRYLNYVRTTHAWDRFVQVAGNGSVRVRIYYSDLASFRFKLPPLDEQKKIVALLSAADREIQLLQRLVVALREHKKGLMQQLLTGKRRVKWNQ